MRYVGRLTIALIALGNLPAPCWGQELPAGSVQPAAAMQPTPATGRSVAASQPLRPMDGSSPDPVAPEEVEGAWIADDQPLPPGAFPSVDSMPYGAEGGPLPVGAPMPGYDDGGGAYCDESCDDGRHGLFGNANYPYGDLWTEVHACRRLWVKGEYLNYWVKGNPLPPLVTTSPIGTPQDQAGVLGLPTTSILFGDERVNEDQRTGGRLTVGYWLIDGQFLGIEASYFMLEEAATEFSAESVFSDGIDPGDQILARPFFNVDTGVQDSAVIAYPDFILNGQQVDLDGTINIRAASDVQGANVLLRHLLWIDFTANWNMYVIGGYRFFRLNDSVLINDVTNVMGGVLGPTTFDSTDFFSADNRFHGGDIGLTGQIYRGRWSLEWLAKVGLGNNHQVINIEGQTITTVNGASAVTTGGLLAQPTNIGKFDRDEFAVIPEVGITLRFDVTPNVRASAGYTFMYMDTVIRSGDQIDLGLNPTQIGGVLVGDPRPAVMFNDEDFYMHGMHAGVEFRY